MFVDEQEWEFGDESEERQGQTGAILGDGSESDEDAGKYLNFSEERIKMRIQNRSPYSCNSLKLSSWSRKRGKC